MTRPGDAAGAGRRRGGWTAFLGALSLRTHFVGSVLLAGGLPMAAFGVLADRIDSRHEEASAELRLRDRATDLAALAGAYLDQHRAAVRALAGAIEQRGLAARVAAGAPPAAWAGALDGALAETRRVYPGFLTMLVADGGARIVAADPARNAAGERNARSGRLVRDRDYWREVVRTGEPYLSGAFLGRGFGRDPIVAVSAPVRDAAGRVALVVEGSLDLRALRALDRNRAMLGRLVLVDGQGAVVVDADRPDAALRPVADDALGRAWRAAGERAAFRYTAPSGDERTVAQARTAAGWTVLLELSHDVVHAGRTRRRAVIVASVCFMLLGAGVVASLLARGVTSAFDRVMALARGMHALDGALPAAAAAAPAVVAPPPAAVPPPAPPPAPDDAFADAPRELRRVAGDLLALHAQLARSADALRGAVAERDATHEALAEVLRSLEETVFERTAELEVALRRAEDASRAKSAFLATMSHELRTPLNSVIGFAGVLRRRATGLSDTDRLYLDRILANGTHLLGLINDVLDLSKIEAGRLELASEPVAVDALLRETLAELEPQARERGLVLALALPDAPPAPLRADPVRLKQVVINLVGNALKFTREGGVEVRLVADADGRARRLVVRDTGIGIPADRLDAIFRPFEQAEAGTTRQFGGTGLGLSISRRLCDAMGFTLTVESAVGVGSTFVVGLDAATGAPADGAADGAADGPSGADVADGVAPGDPASDPADELRALVGAGRGA